VLLGEIGWAHWLPRHGNECASVGYASRCGADLVLEGEVAVAARGFLTEQSNVQVQMFSDVMRKSPNLGRRSKYIQHLKLRYRFAAKKVYGPDYFTLSVRVNFSPR
jgi:hypothetical protein